MVFIRNFRSTSGKALIAMLLSASLLTNPAYAIDTQDSQIFISGFNAYQKKEYSTAIEKMSQVLQKYPDTPLRDMAIFWLARANYKAGHLKDAAKIMTQFFKEYPDSPLRSTVEEELASLVDKYQRGVKITDRAEGEPVVAQKPTEDQAAAQKAAREKAEQERLAKEKAEADRLAQEKAAQDKAEAERLAFEKATQERAAAERLAQEKIEAERLAATKAEQERLAKEKADAERLAQEKVALEQQTRAEQDRLAREKADAERLAVEKATQEKAAAERLAQEKVEAERQAKAKAEQERLAKEKADAERLALEKVALEQQAKAEQARLAREKAEAERLAAEKATREKAAAERLAQEKVEAERQAKAKAEQDRLTKEKADAERLAQEKAAREKAEAEQLAKAKAEQDRLAKEKADAERLAQEKVALEQQAKAEQARLAREKADAERLAAEKATQEKAAAERLAQEKAEAERQAKEKATREKAEAEQQAKAKAELERLAKEKAEAERLAAEKAILEKAAAERLAKEKQAAESLPTEKELAEQARVAAEKVVQSRQKSEEKARLRAEFEKQAAEEQAAMERERLAAERSAAEQAREQLVVKTPAAPVVPTPPPVAPPVVAVTPEPATPSAKAQAEQARLAASDISKAEPAKAEPAKAEPAKVEPAQVAVAEVPVKPAPKPPVKQKPAPVEKRKPAPAPPAKQAKTPPSLREQAITEYKAVIDRYPGSQAAANAAARLKAMGLTYPPAGVGLAAAAPSAPQENAKVLTLEVGQYANVDFSMIGESQTAEAGKRLSIPFEIVNRGNATDSFLLESGFPTEYNVRFAAAVTPETSITKTPSLAAGERFKGLLELDMPPSVIDGERKLYPIKTFSEFDSIVSQSRPVKLIASAPLLRAVIKTDKVQVLPGDRVQYRLTLLNIGSAPARQVTVRLTYPPQLEPVDAAAAGLKPEGKGSLTMEGVQLTSGENRELAVTMQLKDDALAQQELALRAELANLPLKRSDYFLSTAAFVQAVTGVSVTAHQEKVVVLPGQTVAIPLTITNTGNVRDDFSLRPTVAGNLTYAFYQDLNRDGIRQANEPIINHVGPMAPREVAHVVLEIAAAPGEKDGVSVPMTVGFEPESDKTRGALVKMQLVYSRPVLELSMTGKGGKMKPGDVSTLELSCVNNGSSLAKVVEIQSLLPEQLEVVASDPLVSQKNESGYVWRFEELGAGEKRSIKVTYRLRDGAAVGTSIALKNVLKYQDQAGNSY